MEKGKEERLQLAECPVIVAQVGQVAEDDIEFQSLLPSTLELQDHREALHTQFMCCWVHASQILYQPSYFWPGILKQCFYHCVYWVLCTWGMGGISSPILPGRFEGSNSGHGSLGQAPLPTEPSLSGPSLLFLFFALKVFMTVICLLKVLVSYIFLCIDT